MFPTDWCSFKLLSQQKKSNKFCANFLCSAKKKKIANILKSETKPDSAKQFMAFLKYESWMDEQEDDFWGT